MRLASLRFGLDEASADAQEIAEQKAGAAAAAAALDPTSSEHPRAAAAAAAAACAASAVPPGWYVTLDLPVAQYADTVPSLVWSVASDIAAAFPTKPTVLLPRPSKEPKAGPSSGSDVGTIFAPHDGERAHAATEASSLAVDSNDGGLMALLDSGMLRPVRTGSMGTDGGTPTAEASDRPFRASSGTVDSEAASMLRPEVSSPHRRTPRRFVVHYALSTRSGAIRRCNRKDRVRAPGVQPARCLSPRLLLGREEDACGSWDPVLGHRRRSREGQF